jgi:hypothetical protein
MSSIGQENLETVMIDFLGALRRSDFEAAAGLLDHFLAGRGCPPVGGRASGRVGTSALSDVR